MIVGATPVSFLFSPSLFWSGLFWHGSSLVGEKMSLIPFELYHSARVRIAKSCYVLMVLGSFISFFEILGEM